MTIRTRIVLLIVQLAGCVLAGYALDGWLRIAVVLLWTVAIVCGIVALFLPGPDGRAILTIPTRKR